MYIRTISRKNKSGSVVTYVQLAHNERPSAKGNPQAKILYNFGRIENLDLEQLIGDPPLAEKTSQKHLTLFASRGDFPNTGATEKSGESS